MICVAIDTDHRKDENMIKYNNIVFAVFAVQRFTCNAEVESLESLGMVAGFATGIY